jgi:hypothetical protein
MAMSPATGAVYLVNCIIQCIFIEIQDMNDCSLSSKKPGNCESDPASAAGYYRGLSLQTEKLVHHITSFRLQ